MLAQQLVNGLVLGSVYALFALGFTVIFGVLHVINLTYGFYFALGAYLSLWASNVLGWNIFGALAVAVVGTGCLAVVLDALIVTPLRRRDGRYLASLLATMGLALFLYALTTWLFGAEPRRYPASVGEGGSHDFAGVTVSGLQLAILAIVAFVVLGLFWFLKRTRWGVAIRGTGDHELAALLVGLSPTAITAFVSFIAGTLAAIAGTLIGLNFNAVHPYMGEIMMLRGFAVVIIGGLGSMPGAVLAGLLLGMIEVLTAAYISSAYREAITFSVLLATLWFFPQGLLPQARTARV